MEKKPSGDGLVNRLEQAIIDMLDDQEASREIKNVAIANGIKLAMIQHRLESSDVDDYFGDTAG